jgi:hypothetical protein
MKRVLNMKRNRCLHSNFFFGGCGRVGVGRRMAFSNCDTYDDIVLAIGERGISVTPQYQQ